MRIYMRKDVFAFFEKYSRHIKDCDVGGLACMHYTPNAFILTGAKSLVRQFTAQSEVAEYLASGLFRDMRIKRPDGCLLEMAMLTPVNGGMFIVEGNFKILYKMQEDTVMKVIFVLLLQDSSFKIITTTLVHTAT